ncbi:hypothetical protein I3843_16G034500 [Carya illinoinensis]|uniref:Uncharacterized protein n=1 Tax=Carya illinoinensis TaxID=32201 RepID=A0A8T1N1Q1_CARIL|nr:hypothetical protein CIPAW_16G032100 [Carya illinoinensis]KAG6624517.1 hypothetical protein CIPAW_16G032100 [Carya illinoinensis]KAG7941323.1 hypothetical protein I3843_16G034500 [Carya illinoinensis]
MGVRYLLMTLVFYGGLLLLFGSTAFMGTHVSLSNYFDQPPSNHFYPKYLKVVSRKKSTPPPPAPILNVPVHYRRLPPPPPPPAPARNLPQHQRIPPSMPNPSLKPSPPPPTSSKLESSPLPPV